MTKLMIPGCGPPLVLSHAYFSFLKKIDISMSQRHLHRDFWLEIEVENSPKFSGNFLVT